MAPCSGPKNPVQIVGLAGRHPGPAVRIFIAVQEKLCLVGWLAHYNAQLARFFQEIGQKP